MTGEKRLMKNKADTECCKSKEKRKWMQDLLLERRNMGT